MVCPPQAALLSECRGCERGDTVRRDLEADGGSGEKEELSELPLLCPASSIAARRGCASGELICCWDGLSPKLLEADSAHKKLEADSAHKKLVRDF